MDRLLSQPETLVRVVLCTVPTDCVLNVVQALFNARLVACVSQLGSVQSTYRWDGEIKRAEEVQLIIKTCDRSLPAMIQRLEEVHPYDVPEILVLCASSSHAYHEWVVTESTPI